MKALKAIGLCMLLCLAIAVPASADELVTNGNFQTGNLTGWTGPTGNTGFSSVQCGNDPTAGKKGPIAWQMHNKGLFDEYKDVRLEENPKEDKLITTE